MRMIIGFLLIILGVGVVIRAASIAIFMMMIGHWFIFMALGVLTVLIGCLEIAGHDYKKYLWRGKWPPPE